MRWVCEVGVKDECEVGVRGGCEVVSCSQTAFFLSGRKLLMTSVCRNGGEEVVWLQETR